MAEYAIMPKEDYLDACNAVREMTGSTENVKSGDMGAKIRSIKTGTDLPELSTPAGAAHILNGYEAINGAGVKLVGSMPDNGAVSKELAAGESYDVPTGYHNGNGKVTAKDLASQTAGTAAADDMLANEIAWVNGKQITGNIPSRSAADLSANGKVITVPPGHYAYQATKEVASAMQATPTISVDAAGKITASVEQQEGYVESGTKSATKQLSTQGAKTVTPNTSEQVAAEAGNYLTGDIKVAAMPVATQATPEISVDANGKITASAEQPAGYVAAGTKSATKQLTTQGAKTITPGTTDQEAVTAGVYTTGAVQVKGDANLKAENIAEGVTIFGVPGSHKGGSVAPDTCTVVLQAAGEIGTRFKNECWYACTRYVDGAFVPDGVLFTVSPATFPITIQNVVCGSALYVRFNNASADMAVLMVNSTGGSTLFDVSLGMVQCIVKITDTPNITDTVSLDGWT